MAKTIYDKPTRLLIRDMLEEWRLKPGQVFTASRAVTWFAEHYPKLRSSNIVAHLVQASTNDRSRLHHSIKQNDDLLFRVASRQYRLFEPTKDPAPIHEMVEGDVARQDALEPDLEEAENGSGDGEPLPGSSEFLLERDLQNYLARNLECVEPGLRLYAPDEGSALEFDAGNGRRIDILAVDRSGALVVLELKVSRGYDRVVGQLLRYMAWIRLNFAEPGQHVRGMIVCRAMSEDLRLACSSIANVELFEYQLSVTVSKVAALEVP